MKKETIEAISQFLSRVDLKGSEVPAYNQIIAELQELYKVATETPETPEKPKK